MPIMSKLPKMPKVKDVDTEIFSVWHPIIINVSRETIRNEVQRFRVLGSRVIQAPRINA
jgi:hypothetical protein